MDLLNKIRDKVGEVGANVGNNGANLVQNINQKFSGTNDGGVMNGTREFLNSNSMVAKIAFLLVVLIAFLLLLRLGVSLISWWLSPSETPYLVKGMLKGNEARSINQNPAASDSIPIIRSNNEDKGVEFTYSVWINIDPNANITSGNYKHIFSKGNVTTTGSIQDIGKSSCPALYITKTQATGGNNTTVKAVATIETFSTNSTSPTNSVEFIEVDNIPVNKWVNIILRLEGNVFDMYVNGGLSGRVKLAGVAKQNYGNVYVASSGGFEGYLSDLRYWNYGLSIGEIDGLVNTGANTAMSASSVSNTMAKYLSLKWYLS